MNGELHIDPQSMQGAGASIARVTQTFDAAIGKLQSDLAAQGSPWGDDEPGRKFSEGYLPTVQQAFTAIASYRDQLDYAATQLPLDGQRFGSTEQQNRREFENVWPVPPPDQQ